MYSQVLRPVEPVKNKFQTGKFLVWAFLSWRLAFVAFGPKTTIWSSVAFVFLTWQVSNLIEYALHTAAHMRIDLPGFRSMHRLHMEHHKVHYPAAMPLREPPYMDGGGIWAFGPAAVVLVIFFWLVLPRHFVQFVTLAFAFIGIDGYLHDQYHIRGSWLEQYEWFQVRRLRHIHHHHRLKENMSLGGIDTTFDAMFGTFVPNPPPLKPAIAS